MYWSTVLDFYPGVCTTHAWNMDWDMYWSILEYVLEYGLEYVLEYGCNICMDITFDGKLECDYVVPPLNQ